MITKTIEDVRKFARVANTFTFDALENEIRDAANNEIATVISLEEYMVLETYTDNDAIIKKAIENIQNAEVNFALFNYLPVGSIQITKGGVSTILPKGQEDATPKDMRDALRLYKKKAHKALDNVLEIFEKHEAKFTAWKASDQYTNFKDLLVNNTAQFQKHYSIFNSRQTFLQLIPELRIVEQQYIIPAITDNSLIELKSTVSANAIFKKVKNLVSKATVLYTVSKNLGSGLFYQSANGFELRFDILDYERNFTNDKQLSLHIRKQRLEKENEAKEFLKIAVKLIKENAALFKYEAKEITKAKLFINGKGIVAI
jgi:hypothetical protein